MSFSLNEVIEGLMTGHAYQRKLEDDDGVERLYPAGKGYCVHAVHGYNNQGGWGGASTLPLSTLNNGRFPRDGWELFRS